MITYMELSVRAKGFLALWFMVVFLLACISTFRLLMQKNVTKAVPAIGAVAFSYYLVQWCGNINMNSVNVSSTRIPPLFDSISWPWLVLMAMLLTAVNVCFLLQAERWNDTHVSVASLKEAMDNLPVGLCWYSEEGTPILRNRVMEEICYQVTGQNLYDGSFLKRNLMQRMDENSVMMLENGTVWNLVFHTVQTDGEILHEICAYNITQEYEVTRILMEKQKEVQQTGEKLLQYNREMGQLIAAEEILAAKVRIHDELGQGLLLTRKYLLRGGTEEDREKLLQVLRKNNTLMEYSRNENGRSYLDVILEAASDMGVHLMIDGDMPQNRTVRDVVTTAIHENLTNTIRHAQGDEMLVKIRENCGRCVVEFTNSGRIPDGPIEERGGIAMLRTLVEAAGGEMKVEHAPRFKMTLRFQP